MRRVLMMILITSLLLAACATLPAQEQAKETATEEANVALPTPAETQAPPTAGKTTLPEDVVIEFRRSGGIAGVNEDWLIYSDGRITQGSKEWQVSPEAVQQLLAKIESLGFFEMKDNYIPLDTCCDRFSYEVIARSGDKVNNVTTIEAAPGVPAELWQVIQEIDSLIKD